MCEKCVLLDGQLATYRRFMGYHVDALTAERFKSGLQALEEQKKALHPFDPSARADEAP